MRQTLRDLCSHIPRLRDDAAEYIGTRGFTDVAHHAGFDPQSVRNAFKEFDSLSMRQKRDALGDILLALKEW